jgi:hypothetical protein
MNTDQHIHIVAFDIPYPPTYGGAIDVFYRIRALHDLGVKITLHCTYKGERNIYPQLENLCSEVFYYARDTRAVRQLSLLPYAVAGRRNDRLINNLLKDNDPIIFEGLVSCYFLNDKRLKNRVKLFRECNIEHDYFSALGRASKTWWQKVYYRVEARKLKRFEAVLQHATAIAALAHQDEAHFRATYHRVPTFYIPLNHPNTQVTSPMGTGNYILYHGNLQLAENENAAIYLMEHIVPYTPHPFVFAGRNPSPRLQKLAENLPNATLIANPSGIQMDDLIRQAQINLLVTFQATGMKVKLLNALYAGRYVVANPPMVHGTDVAELCIVAPDDRAIVHACNRWMTIPFTEEKKTRREQVLSACYDNITNAKKLLTIINTENQ